MILGTEKRYAAMPRDKVARKLRVATVATDLRARRLKWLQKTESEPSNHRQFLTAM